MIAHLARTFAGLFVTARSRAAVATLFVVMALVPVAELLVIAMFSDLIIDGPERFSRDPSAVYLDVAWFFVAFALTRVVQHAARFVRIAVFRGGLESSGRLRGRSAEAWEWALAFELSIVLVGLIQILTFSVVFVVVSVTVGLVNALVCVVALAIISWLYGGQLHRQQAYLTVDDTTTVAGRVGGRIRDAELGSVVATAALAIVLLVVVVQTLRGAVASTDAIVLFLGLRLLYGQVGNLAGSIMRFARASARRGTLAPDEAAPSPDDEPESTAHRRALLDQALAAGRRGDTQSLAAVVERLSPNATTTERHTLEVAGAFAELAAAGSGTPVAVAWWVRPFPGSAGSWLAPHLVQHFTGRPVIHHSPNATSTEPHIATDRSIAALASSFHAVDRSPASRRIALVRHIDDLDFDVVLARHMDEISVLAAHRDDVENFLDRLATYSVVVTSDVSVAIVCQSYGIACVPVVFDDSDRHAVVADALRDHARAVRMSEPWEPRAVSYDLRRVKWRRIARVETIDQAALGRIARALDEAVRNYDAGIPHPTPGA